MNPVRYILILFMMALGLAACAGSEAGSSEAEIRINEPAARAGSPNGAVYMTLENVGGTDDALISAETDVAEVVEIHETTIDENDVMRMNPVARIDVPAGGSATLQQGGLHVMLMGMADGFSEGDTFELTLNFEQSGPQTIDVPVMQVGGGMMNEGEMEEGEMEMDHNEE